MYSIHPAPLRRFAFGKFVFGIGLFLWALMAPGLSQAACQWLNFSGQPAGASPLSVSFGIAGTVNVSSSAAVGDVLASGTTTANATAGLNCKPGPLSANTPYRAVNGSDTSIMATGVAGVGFRMYQITYGQYYGWNSSNFIAASVDQQVYTNSGQYRLELIKTGAIAGGTVSLGQLSDTSLDGTVLTRWYLGNNVNIVAASTCTVTTPSVSVDLGTVSATEFTGMGSVSATTKAFNIGLNCSANTGLAYMSLSDSSNPANRSSTLSLAAGSTATGVALQLLARGTLVKYGADSSDPYQDGAFPVVGGSAANVNVAFSARYVQTATSVGAGSANGLATFTLSYD